MYNDIMYIIGQTGQLFIIAHCPRFTVDKRLMHSKHSLRYIRCTVFVTVLVLIVVTSLACLVLLRYVSAVCVCFAVRLFNPGLALDRR